MVWGAYVWTDWWHVEGLPLTMTVNAEIANALDTNQQIPESWQQCNSSWRGRC